MLITPKMNIQYPMALERDYAKQLQTYVRKLTAICIKHIPKMVDAIMLNSIRTDDWTEETTDDIERDINEELSILAVILAMFNRVQTFSTKQQDKVFKSVFGSIPKGIPKSEVDKIKRIWVDQNLSLIKSIDQRTLESIRYSLSRNIIKTVDKEMLVEELTDSIKHMANVNENRAALIACDQVGKLNGQLAQLQQMDLGNKYYKWVTMHDNRVRPAHREREGKIYAWDDPPSDGHPGWAIRCRCSAADCYDTDKIGLKPIKGTFTEVRR